MSGNAEHTTQGRSATVIRFEDKGQDMLSLTVNENGEIVDSDLQQWLWVGCKLVRLPILGEPLAIVLKSGEEADTRFNVVSVEQVKP